MATIEVHFDYIGFGNTGTDTQSGWYFVLSAVRRADSDLEKLQLGYYSRPVDLHVFSICTSGKTGCNYSILKDKLVLTSLKKGSNPLAFINKAAHAFAFPGLQIVWPGHEIKCYTMFTKPPTNMKDMSTDEMWNFIEKDRLRANCDQHQVTAMIRNYLDRV